MAVEGTVKVDVTSTGLLGGLRTGILGGGTTGLAGGVGKMAGSLALIGGAITLVVGLLTRILGIFIQSSGILRGTLGAINKSIQLLLKPIGDILGVALMPILFLIKPIAQFFNALMKPYIRDAARAMRAGGTLLRAGQPVEAAGAFALGFQFLVKPFSDALTAGLIFPIKLSIQAFQALGNALLDIVPGGFLVKETFNNTMNSLVTGVDMFTDLSMKGINNMLQGALNFFETEADNARIKMTKPFEDAVTFLDTDWGPRFRDKFRNIFDESLAEIPLGATSSGRGEVIAYTHPETNPQIALYKALGFIK